MHLENNYIRKCDPNPKDRSHFFFSCADPRQLRTNVYVKRCLENDAKYAWKMREEKRLVRGVGGLRSKVDGEVREKSLKCT